MTFPSFLYQRLLLPSPPLQPIRNYIAEDREAKKSASKEDKEAAKAAKEAIQLKYGFALVDGHLEKVRAWFSIVFRSSPPSLPVA